jgi:phosphoribosylanthranilate isomerase
MFITPKIKICGITTKEEIEIVNRNPVDYIGFVVAKSKRRVTIDQVKALKKELKVGVKTVGVFVNESKTVMEHVKKQCGLNVLQLHGDEAIEECNSLEGSLWKCISIKDENSLKEIAMYSELEAVLLDTFVKGAKGGTGVAFRWDLVEGMSQKYKIVLAGGLNPENVSKAVEIVKPYAVDVSSGVEKDGKKDEDLIKKFIRSVKCNGVK